MNFVGHNFGIETFNYESSKIIGKGLKESDATETLFKIKNSMNCVNTTAGFILGLPKENMKTFYDWFMRVAKEDYPLDSIVLNSLWLSETTHTKSEFFNNPSKYGYSFFERDITENFSGKIWKNEYWSFDECHRIAHSTRNSLKENGRNKISSFYSLGLSSLTESKDLISVLNIPFKNLDFNFFQNKHLERIEKYVAKLESLC
jgi:radical SAM superfamily enzyme YgiQ (UPF0313 family)